MSRAMMFCSLCQSPIARADAYPGPGGRWLCADPGSCCLRFIAHALGLAARRQAGKNLPAPDTGVRPA